jgi:hypothetical protein
MVRTYITMVVWMDYDSWCVLHFTWRTYITNIRHNSCGPAVSTYWDPLRAFALHIGLYHLGCLYSLRSRKIRGMLFYINKFPSGTLWGGKEMLQTSELYLRLLFSHLTSLVPYRQNGLVKIYQINWYTLGLWSTGPSELQKYMSAWVQWQVVILIASYLDLW